MGCAIQYDSDGFPYCIKDPDAVLDYKVDFAPLTNGRLCAESDWLQTGETITDHTVTADAGITVDSSSITDSGTSVTVWLSGGTLGVDTTTVYDLVVHVTTSGSRQDDRTFRVEMANR